MISSLPACSRAYQAPAGFRQAAVEWAIKSFAYHTSVDGVFMHKFGGAKKAANPDTCTVEADSLHPNAMRAFPGSL